MQGPCRAAPGQLLPLEATWMRALPCPTTTSLSGAGVPLQQADRKRPAGLEPPLAVSKQTVRTKRDGARPHSRPLPLHPEGPVMRPELQPWAERTRAISGPTRTRRGQLARAT
ncbi:hypothetical protein KIL84_005841 [Mauremys mutica]|uniref:Uncharacterized protein n=1 Tax=Mauremys mutica TaxID=74926 RepID=A0A9D4B458_9SAUR|nr:hypothetical protein KIL84_005841 [Mauremys mutica]